MKKTLLTLIALFISTITFAYYIEIDGIYYSLNVENKTAEVTHDGYYYDVTGYKPQITIPSSITYNSETYSVTSIGERAFFKCSSLSSITIPNSITSIGNEAFSSCYSLTSISIPNSVTSIGDAAFSFCSSLSSITIPNSVTSIGNNAFYSCSSLTNIEVDSDNKNFASINGVLYNKDITTLIYCPERKTSILIPNSVTSIENRAFYSSSLSSIVIPNNVTSIGNEAFSHCSSLSSISIPNSVTSIGNEAFSSCSSLTSISISNNVTSINERAFTHCSSLSSIVIPNSVTSIGEYAFYYCSSLSSIVIPNNVTSIGNEAFSHCSSLSSISIPNNITNIKFGTFLNCSKLRTIKLGNAIETIEGKTFQGCIALYSLEITTKIPPIIYASTFTNVSRTMQVKVPCSAVADYQSSNYWNEFSNFVENPYKLTAITNDENMGRAFVTKKNTCDDITAQVIAQPLPNYEFVKWSDGFTENPHTIYVTNDTTITAEFRVTSTPIENTTDSNISIFTHNNTLHIEGLESDYHILDATGRLIYSGNATTLTLPHGIYLITINGETQKIIL